MRVKSTVERKPFEKLTVMRKVQISRARVDTVSSRSRYRAGELIKCTPLTEFYLYPAKAPCTFLASDERDQGFETGSLRACPF